MRTNRFDFLEISNQASQVTPQTTQTPAEPDEGVIRFDAPALPTSSETVVQVREAAHVEEEVLYQRKTLRVMEVFGSRGTVAGAFSYPTGIAIDRTGIMFVADAYNHRLQRITPDGGVAIVGGRGNGRGQFIAPMGLAIDEDRSFYVVEQGNHRLQKFSADGTFQFSLGGEGSRPGELRGPTGVAVSRGTRIIYIADTGNARIQCFNSSGIHIAVLGAPGTNHPRMSNPQAVACDSHGNVFVADTLSHRILQFDPAGRFIAFYGGVPNPSNRLPDLILSEPHALGFDERDRLYIADGLRTQGRLTAISPATGTIHTVLENVGRGLGHLARPGGIAAAPIAQSKLDPGTERGDIYVSDTMNHRILRFVWY
jgi:DNA-binding beta-propeller fold protein YncE